MPWQKGETGNAGGVRSGVLSDAKQLALMIREYTGEGRELVLELLELAGMGPRADPALRTNSPAERRARAEVIKFLIERVYGRPLQEINLSVGVREEQGQLAPLSEHALAELAGQALLTHVTASQDDEPEPDVEDAELVEDDASDEPGDEDEDQEHDE